MTSSVSIALGLGSNIGDGPAAIHAAIRDLARGGVDDLHLSPLYRSSPVGPQDQPDYTNAVARGRTSLDPHALLDLCKRIERGHGRAPGGARWGPRPLDIDILIYGRISIQDPDLIIPHKELGNRLFVLLPLVDVAENLCLPDGTPVAQYAAPRIRRLHAAGQKIAKIIEI